MESAIANFLGTGERSLAKVSHNVTHNWASLYEHSTWFCANIYRSYPHRF